MTGDLTRRAYALFFKVSLIMLFCSGFYGCSLWPEAYERPVAEQGNMEIEQLMPLLVMTEDRLDLLVEAGAVHCIPGRLKSLQIKLEDIRLDMEHDFFNESQKSIFHLFDEAEEAARYLDLLNRRTECVGDFITKSAEEENIIQIVSTLNSLLNCNCKVFDNDTLLNKSFSEKLKTGINIIKNEENIVVEIHKPETLADNFVIEQTMADAGVNDDQFSTYVYSEKTNKIGGGKPFFVAKDRIAYTGKKMKTLRAWELKQVTAESDSETK